LFAQHMLASWQQQQRAMYTLRGRHRCAVGRTS
jgi:hypothetical protein